MDWTLPQWLWDELVIAEARRRERAGEGRVIEDGLGGCVQWVPSGMGDGGEDGQPDPSQVYFKPKTGGA
jgi:hypothetical protein